MEQALKTLFDYQDFEQNAALQRLINSVHARYSARELTLEEEELINAAGNTDAPYPKTSQEDQKP